MARRPPKYGAKQIAFLRSRFQRMNTRDLTEEFNRRYGTTKTETAINSCLKNHRITCGRPPGNRLVTRRLRIYTEKQIEYLRIQYAGRSLAQLTELFNRRFGENKSVRQIRAAVHNRGFTSGRTGRFPKGHKPWNAGTKGLTGRNRTTFKLGNVPPNRKPLGTERISKDGYIEIKVAERNPYTGFPTRYKCKHVHIWEQKHGPVPKGHTVIFRDGNSLNCEYGNLLCVSRAELLLLNRHGYKDAPAEVKASILAMVRLKAKVFGLQAKGR